MIPLLVSLGVFAIFVALLLVEWADNIAYENSMTQTIHRLFDPVEVEAQRLAKQEIAEVEWAAGLIDMPQHLVEQGTKTSLYTHRVIMKDLDSIAVGTWNEGDPPIMRDYEVVPLDEPYTETTVWGVKV